MVFVFGLHTLWLLDFSKIYGLKRLKPKNNGCTNSYECCDLTEKVYLQYIVCIFLYERTLWFLFLFFTDNRSHYEFRWTPTERRLLATWIDDFAPLGLKYTRWIEWSGCYGIVRKSKYTIIMHKNFVKIVFISAIFSKISWNLFTIYELKRSRCLWSFVRKSSWKKISSKYT